MLIGSTSKILYSLELGPLQISLNPTLNFRNIGIGPGPLNLTFGHAIELQNTTKSFIYGYLVEK